MNKKFDKDKDWLYNEYIILGKSAQIIANELFISVTTIFDWLKRFNIKTDKYTKIPPYEKLYDLYITKELTSYDIMKIFDVSSPTVLNWLYKYNIKTRDNSESRFLYYRKNSNVKEYISERLKLLWSNEKYAKQQSKTKIELYKYHPELRIQMSATRQNIPLNEWVGFRSSDSDIRHSYEYKQWRSKVFERDNYTCQCCLKRGGHNLQAHHKENFSSNKDLRFDIDNGVTLCSNCHSLSFKGSFHSMYGILSNTKEQLEEYITNKRKELNITEDSRNESLLYCTNTN